MIGIPITLIGLIIAIGFGGTMQDVMQTIAYVVGFVLAFIGLALIFSPYIEKRRAARRERSL